MEISLGTVFSVFIAMIGAGSTVYAFMRTRKNDIKEDVKEAASIAFELKALKEGISEFKAEMKAAMSSHQEMVLKNRDDIKDIERTVSALFREVDLLKAGAKL